jgi:hypothetical protein
MSVEKLRIRLEALKNEFESGQKMLTDSEARQAQLRDTLLRISGAIQVLEELLSNDETNNGSEPQATSNEVQISEKEIMNSSTI